MNFQQAISGYKRTWVVGQIIKTLLILSVLFVIAVILYGLADSVWALDNGARTLINKCIIGFTGIAALWIILRAVRTPRPEIASKADAMTGEMKNSKKIRAASDLSTQKSSSPLNEYLSNQAQEQAVKEIKAIPIKKKIPLKAITLTTLVLAAVVGTGLGIRQFHPEAYDTVAQRLLHPSKDIPPYSPLKFNITKQAPNTVYGGTNQVRVEVTGGELTEDIVCQVRNKNTGEIETISTFQESKNIFSKRFNNILTDIEFSFAHGRARSEWQSIKVLLQPKFTSVDVKITPPSYTKRKSIEFPLEGNEVKIINGSKIDLTITSNRPLSGGKLTIRSEDITEPIEVAGIPNSNEPKKVTFSWVASKSTSIQCLINDMRKTPSEAPLEFAILTRADLAPVAQLTSPARFVLATPSSKIPLIGEVSDDFEVESVHLVRTLVGFRDRAKELATSVSHDSFEFKKELDLGKLGVKDKQVLEFYLEANDKNPSMLGIGTSDVVRVAIISEEEYARRLRYASDLKEFSIRFSVLRNAIQDAIRSLKKLNKINLEKQAEPFEIEKKAALKTHLNSRVTALKLAEDFQAFKLEEDLTEKAVKASELLLENYDQLQELNYLNGFRHNQDQIEEMLNRLGALLNKTKEQEQKAKDVEKWARVAELAAIYRKLYFNQKSMFTRLGRIATELSKGIKRNAGQITPLGETQQKSRQQLQQFAKDLKKAAAELPQHEDLLMGDCEIWLDKFAELNIPEPMDAASLSCKLGKSHDATKHAHLAYTLMQQLVDMKGNEFAKLIRGEIDKKPDEPEDIAQTKKEMLDALLQQQKPQQEQEEQQQGGGRGQGGKPMPGQGGGGRGKRANGNTPMFGPQRQNYSQGSGKGNGNGQGNGNGKGNQNKPKVSGKNSLKSNKKRDSETLQSSRSNVPSKYKDAVKKFYSE